MVETIGQAYRGAEFGDLVLWIGADGSVATVVDGFEEPGRSSDERSTASAHPVERYRSASAP